MTKTVSHNGTQAAAKAAPNQQAAVAKQVSPDLAKTAKAKPTADKMVKLSDSAGHDTADKPLTTKRSTSPAKKASTSTKKTSTKRTNSKKASTLSKTSAAKKITSAAHKTTRRTRKVAKAEDVIKLTLAEYIHRCVKKQFTHMMRYEADVLRDIDPEPLHQMRVNSRRLRSTMQCFSDVVTMPEGYQPKHLRRFNQPLGALRNLDVVIQRLQVDYYPMLSEAEQVLLDRALKRLHKKRRRAFKAAKKAINKQSFSAIYEAWLKQPEYTASAQQSVSLTLPHFLMPQLAKFLSHPAWSIAAADVNPANQGQLHNLRKVCKHWRYQIDPVKTTDNAAWLASLKELQYCLGTLQDLAVLQQMLTANLPKKCTTPELDKIFQQQHTDALTAWDQLRQPYLDAKHHHQCYDWVLNAL